MVCTYFLSCGIHLSMGHLSMDPPSMGHVTTKNKAHSRKEWSMKSYQENGTTIVVYTSEELATLERLLGADR